MKCAFGFSLVELLVAIVIASGMAIAAANTRFFLEGRLRGRLERAGAAATLRTASTLLRAELESLGSDAISGGDLVAVSGTSLTYRAHRGGGAICRIAPDSVLIEPARLGRWRTRDPIAGRDSLMVYRPAGVGRPEGWVPVALLGGPAPAMCPDGAGADLYFTSLDSVAIAAAGLPTASIGRWFETAALTGYASSVGWQLGYTGLSASASIQPVAGPLAGRAGFRPTINDRLGFPAGTLADGAEFEVSLVAVARRDIAVGSGRSLPGADSLRLLVRLENQP